MTTKLQNTIESGTTRIDEIKKNICECKSPQICKAEVYDMWDGIFDPENSDQ